jgi:hypothetical protein
MPFTPYRGQVVVCVDASIAANRWHAANPLIRDKLYTIHGVFDDGVYVCIDNSGRHWQTTRFRPVPLKKTTATRTTSIDFAYEILRKASRKAPQRVSLDRR